MNKRLKSWLQRSLLVIVSVIIALLIAELFYRQHWIEFYANELQLLNTGNSKYETTTLVFGDSFTARRDGYVNMLRNEFPGERLVNCAIPGTGIRETSCFFSNRLEKFTPDRIVFQLYTGNDLLDIEHGAKWKDAGIVRNFYWKISDLLLVTRYFNYKSGQVKDWMNGGRHDAKQVDEFTPETYSARTKMLLNALPGHIDNCIFLKNGRTDEMHYLTDRLTRLIKSCDTNISIAVMVIPHCTQVNDYYREKYVKLGEKNLQPEHRYDVEYPFLTALRNELNGFSNVSILNPLPALQKADSAGHRVYYENDPHLSPAGDSVIYRELIFYLKLNTAILYSR